MTRTFKSEKSCFGWIYFYQGTTIPCGLNYSAPLSGCSFHLKMTKAD